MPRARSLDTYPQQFWTLIEKAAIEKVAFEMPVEEWAEGMKLQGKFYAFRGALVRENAALMAKPDSPYKAKIVLALEQAKAVACWLDRSRAPCVRFTHRDVTPEALRLQQMLDGAGVKTQEQLLAESAARLKDLEQSGGKYG